ncbi:MAG: moaA/nifB/ppqE/nirJ protein family for cofactor bionsynthesis, partial [uncultured bacterium]
GTSTVYLTGGEPTLRPKLIEAADRIFPRMSLVSNGVEEVSRKIRRRIWISVDGPKEVHNKIRGAEVFDRIMANIKNDRRVVLAPTLSATNYHYIDDIVKIARASGVDGVTFSVYTSHRGSGDLYLLEGEKLDWTIKKLLSAWKKNKDIVFLTPSIIKSLYKKSYYRKCYFLRKNIVAFDANLNVKKPCTLGAGVKCRTCGCIVPVFSAALRRGDVRTWLLLDRFFPEKYSRE